MDVVDVCARGVPVDLRVFLVALQMWQQYRVIGVIARHTLLTCLAHPDGPLVSDGLAFAARHAGPCRGLVERLFLDSNLHKLVTLLTATTPATRTLAAPS